MDKIIDGGKDERGHDYWWEDNPYISSEIARLRAEIARLRAEIERLAAERLAGGSPGRCGAVPTGRSCG